MRLRQLYLAGSQSSGGPPHDLIAVTEQQATDYAMEAGLPECSPAMGGISGAAQPAGPGQPPQPGTVGQPGQAGGPGASGSAGQPPQSVPNPAVNR